jgi:lysozyme
MPTLAGCGGGRQQAASSSPGISGNYPSQTARAGLDAVIDISHNVTVTDFNAVRRQSNIMAVLHKATEGGDWVDPSYGPRRPQAEAAGLLWGAYHFGTRQFSGVQQAKIFLAAVRPTPTTLLALDFEPNDPNPRNTMTLLQAEAFVLTVQQATGRLPLLYTRSAFADGKPSGRSRVGLREPINQRSIVSRCDLWLADYRDEPQVPMAWADRGWRLWQYAGDDSEDKAAYGTVPRSVAGVSHCDRNVFAGDAAALQRYWLGGAGRAS